MNYFLHDNAIIPVGDPDQRLQTKVRPHNRYMTLLEYHWLQLIIIVMDMGFFICIFLSIDIPDDRSK